MIDDGLEEGAIVAHQQNGGVDPAQVVLEPAAGLEVEMVGGLVEEQDVGRRDQLARQAQPSAFPAAQPVERLGARLVGVETEAMEDGVDARGDAVAVLPLEALEVSVVSGEHLRSATVARLGEGGSLLRQRSLEREEIAERARGRLPHGRSPGEGAVLLQQAEPQRPAPRHAAPRRGPGRR